MKTVQQLLVIYVLLTAACLHEPEAGPEPEIDISFFISVWDLYEASYPLLAYQNINWMDIGEAYYALAEQAETSDEMMMIIVDMISELEDPSITIFNSDGDVIHTFEKEYQSNVDMDVLMENYLEPNGYAGKVGGFAWCDPAVLPYAYFDTLPTSYDTLAAEAFDAFIGQCVDNDVPAVILDVRMNPVGCHAGFGWYNHFVMSRFLSYSHVGAVYRYRVGPEYDMYGDWHPAIDPAGPYRYTGTVYLLAGGGCTYAAEDMVANMEYFPNTVVIGENTGGTSTYTGSSASFLDEASGLSWFVKVGTMTLLTYNLEWVEGNGVEPDIYVEATEADFAAGVDPVLEYAIELLD